MIIKNGEFLIGCHASIYHHAPDLSTLKHVPDKVQRRIALDVLTRRPPLKQGQIAARQHIGHLEKRTHKHIDSIKALQSDGLVDLLETRW